MLELALLGRSGGKTVDPSAKLAVIDQRIADMDGLRRADIAVIDQRIADMDGLRRTDTARLMERIASLEQQVQEATQSIAILRQSPMLRLGRALGMPVRLLIRARSRLTQMGQKRRISNAAPVPSLQQGGPQKTDEGLPLRVTMLVADDRIDRRVLLEARTIAARGAQILVISVPYPDAVDLDQQEFPEVKIIRIDTSKAATVERDLDTGRLKGMGFDWKHVYFYTHQFLEAAIAQPADLIVAHDLPVLPAAVAAADMLGARLLYDAHELYPEQLHFGEERIELYRKVEQALIRLPDTVITVNKSIAEEMARRYEVDEPMVVLNAPNAAGMTVPVPRSTLLRQAFPIAENTRILLFQGSLSLNRNLEALVEAMAYVQSQDVVLVVMGPGEAKRRDLEGIAKALGIIGTRVFFHEAVPQSTLLAYTSSADFGIIPYPAIDINTTLCTPNKLFEFFVAGIPIVANDLPELRRFVLGNGAGITHPMVSASEIAAAIDRMARADLSAYREAVERTAASMTWQAQEPVVEAAYVSAMRG
jgi:glycosyltransferase involved in cell wall biosynthesis